MAHRCTQCGALFEISRRGRPRRYCSRSCQARAYRARKTRHPAPHRSRPTALTRARIVAAAVELADCAGLDAVTMRRLATELGVATMSLYQHFPGKDALVATMTDTVVGEGRSTPEVSGGWRARLEVEAQAEWRLYRRHPWVLEILATTRPPVGPNTLAVFDRALSAAAATGLPARTALPIYLAVSGLVQGLALLPTAEQAATVRTGQPADQWWHQQAETFGELLAGGEYPFLAGHLDLADGDGLTDFEALFEFALTTLLDGLAAGLATLDGAHERCRRAAGGQPADDLGSRICCTVPAVIRESNPAADGAAGPTPMPSPPIDTTVASVARVYDCFLDGKDNYAADRAVFEQVVRSAPQAVEIGRINRDWLIRAVRFLAGRARIDQFIDVGAGLPAAENTHEAARRMNPAARVVYVDNDPVVAVHGRALLEEDDRTHMVTGDLTRPDDVLDHPTVAEHIDFNRPLALILCAALHHVPDSERPSEVMRRYIDRLPSGSYLALTHFHDPQDEGKGAQLARFIEGVFSNSSMGSGFFRTRAEIESFFGDLEPVAPGIVRLSDWWPDGPDLGPKNTVDDILIGGVARKP